MLSTKTELKEHKAAATSTTTAGGGEPHERVVAEINRVAKEELGCYHQFFPTPAIIWNPPKAKKYVDPSSGDYREHPSLQDVLTGVIGAQLKLGRATQRIVNCWDASEFIALRIIIAPRHGEEGRELEPDDSDWWATYECPRGIFVQPRPCATETAYYKSRRKKTTKQEPRTGQAVPHGSAWSLVAATEQPICTTHEPATTARGGVVDWPAAIKSAGEDATSDSKTEVINEAKTQDDDPWDDHGQTLPSDDSETTQWASCFEKCKLVAEIERISKRLTVGCFEFTSLGPSVVARVADAVDAVDATDDEVAKKDGGMDIVEVD